MKKQSNKHQSRRALQFVMIFTILGLLLCAADINTSNLAMAQEGIAPLLLDVDDPYEDHYIVVYKEFQAADFDLAVRSDRLAITAAGGEINFVYDTALQGYAAYLPEKALELVRRNPRVDYVIIDGWVHLDDDGGEVTPDATQTGATWGIDRIDQRSLPLNSQYEYYSTASNVYVYILDTGIRSTHVEFEGRAFKVYDSIGDGQNGNDCEGHGTHVAGTIGSKTYGVAKKARLYAVRVLNCSGSGTYSQIIAGVNWVANNHKKPSVANMSLGGPPYAPLETAVKTAISKGITFVVAAGNDDENACNHTPAKVAQAITVGSTTSSDYRSYFSNWGSCVDLFAPGSSILSTSYVSNTATTTKSGTSMASPHVAGVVALYLSENPTASPNAVTNAILGATTKNIVSDPMGSPNRLLYSRVVSEPVPSPVGKAPSGTISDTTPTYTWTSVTGATSYNYQVLKAGQVIYNKTVGSAYCSGSLCSHTGTKVLPYANYIWRVRAQVGGTWGAFSSNVAFTVVKPITSLWSSFNGSMGGWETVTGAWGISAGNYLKGATAVPDTFASAYYDYDFSKFKYEVMMRRFGDCTTCANAIMFRGTPNPLDSIYEWNEGYYFAYTNTGSYIVGKFIDGVWVYLIPWTSSAAIHQDNWNRLKVIAWGDTLKFYINHQLVYTTTDSSHASGAPGIMFYPGSTPSGNKLYVDWSYISTTDMTFMEFDRIETVESGQVELGGDSPFMAPDIPDTGTE